MSGVKDYVSTRVFDGIRPVSPERARALRENYRRAAANLPPRVYAFVKISNVGATHVRVHKVIMPHICADGGYVQTISLNAFCHGRVKDPRKSRCWSPNYLYYGRPWDEFEAVSRAADESLKTVGAEDWVSDLALPVTVHVGLWAFYEAIGYDYKSRRWSPGC